MLKSRWWKHLMTWFDSRIEIEFSIVTNGENEMAKVVNKINVERAQSPRVELGMKFIDDCGEIYVLATSNYCLININTGENLDHVDYEHDRVSEVEDQANVTFIDVNTITIE